MISQPDWEWDWGTNTGYLDLRDDGVYLPRRTMEISYPNATVNIDLDEDGALIGIEVIG